VNGGIYGSVQGNGWEYRILGRVFQIAGMMSLTDTD